MFITAPTGSAPFSPKRTAAAIHHCQVAACQTLVRAARPSTATPGSQNRWAGPDAELSGVKSASNSAARSLKAEWLSYWLEQRSARQKKKKKESVGVRTMQAAAEPLIGAPDAHSCVIKHPAQLVCSQVGINQSQLINFFFFLQTICLCAVLARHHVHTHLLARLLSIRPPATT